MRVTKKIARKIVFPIAFKLGLDKVVRAISKNGILHVMYHGVVESDSCYFSPRHISKDQFEEHLKYYQENFEIISVEESFRKVLGGEAVDKKYLTISFDDGFRNNLTTALPLLEKYNVPTTFFISSICLGKNQKKYLWSEIVSAINYFYRNEPIEINNMVFNNLICKKDNIYLPDYIKGLSYEDRNDILDVLSDKYDLSSKIKKLPSEVWMLLDKDELIELSKSKIVTIGSHGHDHYNLAEIDKQSAELELRMSKKMLDDALGYQINLIAYPDGSYNEEVKDIASKVGYTGQFAVGYRLVSDYSDARIMNRHGISSTTTFESNMLMLNLAFRKKSVS